MITPMVRVGTFALALTAVTGVTATGAHAQVALCPSPKIGVVVENPASGGELVRICVTPGPLLSPGPPNVTPTSCPGGRRGVVVFLGSEEIVYACVTL